MNPAAMSAAVVGAALVDLAQRWTVLVSCDPYDVPSQHCGGRRIRGADEMRAGGAS
jgi:hypothetical protein